MKKKLIGIFVCMLLITTALSVSGTVIIKKAPISTSIGDTLYVGGSGPNNYTKIQDAIDNATYLDTIFVYSGTYYEHVKIHTTVVLQGEDKESTIIDAGGRGDVIFVSADNVEISGFSIINSGDNWPEAGIKPHFIEHCIITDNIISNCGFGILTFVTHDVTISGNIVIDNDHGIHLQGTEYSYISRNNIQNNRIGMYLNDASHIEIIENNFIDNERHFDFYGALLNDINENYWERFVNIGPKIIFGIPFLLFPLPSFIFDWNPAEEPYDIGG
jgi:parallel beta-helix repeat protein